MVGAHVEVRRDARMKGPGRLELEARELHDVELRVAGEKGERGRTEVAPERRPPASRLRHGMAPRRRPCSCRSSRLPRRQAHGPCGRTAPPRREPAPPGPPPPPPPVPAPTLRGSAQAPTACSNHSRSKPPSRISAAGSDRRASSSRGGHERLSASATSTPCACRWRAQARPVSPSPTTTVRPCTVRSTYRTLRVARPTRISTRVTIQRRTMTRGSGHPLSSKW